jgi:hypothetical protein
MAVSLLGSIDWHDLPIDALSITSAGIELVVTPWMENKNAFGRYRLSITEAEILEVDITGSLSANDSDGLEVNSFDYTLVSSRRISGKIGILPGDAGHWSISFGNANWSLEAA